MGKTAQQTTGNDFFKSEEFRQLSERLHGQRFAIFHGLRHKLFSPTDVDLNELIDWGFGHSKLGKDEKPNPERREVLHNFLIDYLETLVFREVNRGAIVRTFKIILENGMMNTNQFKAFFFSLSSNSQSLKDELFDVYSEWTKNRMK